MEDRVARSGAYRGRWERMKETKGEDREIGKDNE